MGEQRDIKRVFFMIGIILSLVLIIFLLLYLYIFTDLFKGKDVLFQKYIIQNVDAFSEIFDISKEEEYLNILQNEDYKENTNAEITYLENEDDEEEHYTLKTEGNVKNSEGEAYVNLGIDYKGTNVVGLEFLKQEEVYGIRLSNIVQQFASFENKNLQYLISSMGYDGKYISDSIKKINFEGNLKFTDEEIETLKNTYIPLIIADLNNNNFKINKNVFITLSNGESPKTTSYTLNLNENELNNICKRVLNQAINDEILLNKLDKIDQKIIEAGFLEPESSSLKEKYKEELEKSLENFEYTGDDESTISIVVYVRKGQTLRTQIKTNNQEILIDLGESEIPSISVSSIKAEEDRSVTKTLKIGKKVDENLANYDVNYFDDTNNLQISVKMEKSEQNIKNNAQIIFYNDKIRNLNFNINQEITRNVSEQLPVSFNAKNNVLLSNYEGDRINTLIGNLKNRFITKLENVQSEINTKSLNNILVWINDREERIRLEKENDIEIRKKQFNNKFELYAGKNLEAEHIHRLINVVSKNMSNYQVISGNKIAMYIQDGQENIEKAQQLLNAITDKNTYNVEIKYSQDGLINEITIEVYKEE